MAPFEAVIALTFFAHKFLLYDAGVLLDGLVVAGVVEQDEEGWPLLGKLFGVFKGDFSDQWDALALGPGLELVVAVLIKRAGNLFSEGNVKQH